MKHAVIVGHPDPGSFNLSVAEAYCAALKEKGHAVVLRDLYRLGFDPRLAAGELPRPGGFSPGEDVVAERALIGDCDAFAFVHPLWFYAPPAIVKGYMDRVFGMGFGYGPVKGGGNRPLLAGRKLVCLTSSGAPAAWLQADGAWAAIRRLSDEHFCAVCGLELLEHLHFGDIVPGMREDAVETELDRVRDAVERLF